MSRMSITETVLREKRSEIVSQAMHNDCDLSRFRNQVEVAEKWKAALDLQLEEVDEAIKVLT